MLLTLHTKRLVKTDVFWEINLFTIQSKASRGYTVENYSILPTWRSKTRFRKKGVRCSTETVRTLTKWQNLRARYINQWSTMNFLQLLISFPKVRVIQNGLCGHMVWSKKKWLHLSWCKIKSIKLSPPRSAPYLATSPGKLSTSFSFDSKVIRKKRCIKTALWRFRTD